MKYFSKFYNIKICEVKNIMNIIDYIYIYILHLVDMHFPVFKFTLIIGYLQRL